MRVRGGTDVLDGLKNVKRKKIVFEKSKLIQMLTYIICIRKVILDTTDQGSHNQKSTSKLYTVKESQ